MAITSIMNASPAAAKAFIDNLGFTGITIGIVKKCAVGEYPKSWIGRSQAA